MSRADLPLAAAAVSAGLVLAAAVHWGKPAVAALLPPLSAVEARAEAKALRAEAETLKSQVKRLSRPVSKNCNLWERRGFGWRCLRDVRPYDLEPCLKAVEDRKNQMLKAIEEAGR